MPSFAATSPPSIEFIYHGERGIRLVDIYDYPNTLSQLDGADSTRDMAQVFNSREAYWEDHVWYIRHVFCTVSSKYYHNYAHCSLLMFHVSAYVCAI